MAVKFKLDPKTQEVISAEYDIDYAGFLRDAKTDAARMHNLDARIRRTVKSLGLSDSRPLKDADHKKLAAEKNAAALIKDFENAGGDIAGAHWAYRNLAAEIDKLEEKAAKEVFAQVATKVDARIKEIEKQLTLLNTELDKLNVTKRGYMKQITAATERVSKDFAKNLEEVQAGVAKLAKGYSAVAWDFDQTRKYMKKK